METQKHNPVGWFEIPVTDMERAIAFYEGVFGLTLERHTLGELDMAWFTWTPDAVGAPGSLVKHASYTPSKEGVLIYFTAPDGDIALGLARAKAAGGTVLAEKKPIGEHGFVGVLLDTEGNRIALHSMR